MPRSLPDRPAAVFLDAGNTLIYPDPPVGLVYSEHAAAHGLRLPPEEMERSFRRCWRELVQRTHASPEDYLQPPDPDGRKWWRRLVDMMLREVGEVRDPNALFEELYSFYGTGEAWGIFPDVKPALARLSQRDLHVGLISNWDSRLETVLADLHLKDSFRSLTISSYVGYMKPDSRIFRAALESAGGPAPADCLHVGDSLTEDVEGARSAGVFPVLLDRKGKAQAGCPTIRSLAELPDLLG